MFNEQTIEEEVSAAVHAQWMQTKHQQGVTTRLAEDDEELMVPYDQLSEKAKELDRGSVRAVLAGIRGAGYIVIEGSNAMVRTLPDVVTREPTLLDATVQFDGGKHVAIARVLNLHGLPFSDPDALNVSVLRFESEPTITLEPKESENGDGPEGD